MIDQINKDFKEFIKKVKLKKVEYKWFNEESNSFIVIIPKENVFKDLNDSLKVVVPADQVTLAPWKITRAQKYKKWLFEKQKGRCAECGKELTKMDKILHHDPPLGEKGSLFIDFKGITRNRYVCKDCHKRIGKRSKTK